MNETSLTQMEETNKCYRTVSKINTPVSFYCNYSLANITATYGAIAEGVGTVAVRI